VEQPDEHYNVAERHCKNRTEAARPPFFVRYWLLASPIPAVPPHARAGCRRGRSPR
jgi:hypothetical protein